MLTRYLVTGVVGFIDFNIVRFFRDNAKQVTILDTFHTVKRMNIIRLTRAIEHIEEVLNNDETIKKAVKDMNIIIHQSAIPSVPKSIQDPIQTNHANITGTLKLLHAAAGNNVKRFVYASSSSAYGFNQTLPKQENMPGS